MKNKFFSKIIIPVVLSIAVAQGTEDVSMQATKVAVFKNGYSQVSMAGHICSQDTQLRLKNVPVPILGSFWWTAPEGTSVQEVRSESITEQAPQKQYSTIDFLLANTGQPVEVMLNNGVKITGTICAPQENKTETSFRPCHYNEPQVKPYKNGPDILTQPVMVAQLRTVGGIVTLREQNILYAEILNNTPKYPTEEKQVPAMVFNLSQPAEGKTLQVSSLSSGLSWLPSYRLDLGNDGKAYFQCKAMVMNELIDLNNVQLELVMGYPALGKYLLPSPVAQYHTLNQFLGILSGTSNISTGLTSQAILTNNNNYGYVAEQQTDSSSLTQAEDLFFYSIPNFSCATGQTVTREIFSGEVAYSHVYTWHVPTQTNIERWERSKQGSYMSNVESPTDVWHCVRINNTLQTPWTTGVLDCYAEGRLVGRTEINFTAQGGTTMVRLNKTMQAPVQYTENILKREGTALTLEGKLSLTNHMNKEMKVVITKAVTGTPLSASDHATTTCTPNFGDNPNGEFRWEITVPAGKTKTVNYQYNFEES